MNRIFAALASLATTLHAEPPLIESFRLDLTAHEIAQGRALQVRSAASQAYLYQLPAFLHFRQIGEFIQGREYLAPGETPLGGWVLVRDLSTPKTINTMPNVDTLYGAAFVWLDKQGPVVITVPEIKDRYYSVALHDAWFNSIDVIGTRTNGGNGGSYLIAPPGWSGERPEGIERVIISSTSVINLYQRIYLNAADDISKIRALQDQIRIAPLASWKESGAKFPPVDDKVFRVAGLRDTRDPLRFFEAANAYAAIAQPPPGDEALHAWFASAGLGPGAKLPADDATRKAIAEGAAEAQHVINAAICAGPFRNGWRLPKANNAKHGPHSLDRSVAQLLHIGVLPVEEALYFISYRDGSGAPLDGRKSNRLTFAKGQLPPIDPRAFWSLTMYNEKSLLVDNPLQRYAIRPDTEGLTFGEDGSLTLYLQHERPGNALPGNWLPAPDGTFIVALRCYMPQPAALDGSWFPPSILPVP